VLKHATDYLIERVLIALNKELGHLAHSALDIPAERDAFEYGRMTGMYAGLKRAIALCDEALTLDEEDNDHGSKRRGEPPTFRN
jgi:hypothetical protein